MPEVATGSVRGQQRVVFSLQLLFVSICAGVFWLNAGWPSAMAVFFGGGVCILSALMLGGGVERAARTRDFSLWQLYGGAVFRFVFVLLGLAVGMGGLKLEPLAVMLGFIVAQLVFPVAARYAKSRG